MKILIIEDDLIIKKELAILLKENNFEAFPLDDFENPIPTIKNENPNLILLDINLPYESGFDLCKKIHQETQIPIIFVTSRNTWEDELKSIQVGGIDFITKPYNKLILLEKIKRALNITSLKNTREITKKGYTLDLHLSILKYNNREVELTRNEFRILYYFFINPERVITKEELLEFLWNDKYYLDENILNVNINRLRKKAEEIGIPNILETVWKVGYKL